MATSSCLQWRCTIVRATNGLTADPCHGVDLATLLRLPSIHVYFMQTQDSSSYILVIFFFIDVFFFSPPSCLFPPIRKIIVGDAHFPFMKKRISKNNNFCACM